MSVYIFYYANILSKYFTKEGLRLYEIFLNEKRIQISENWLNESIINSALMIQHSSE